MRKLLPFAVLAPLLALAYILADYGMTTGHELPANSSRRYDPYGASAIRELLEVRGATVHLLERPLPGRAEGATLVMALPASFGEFEDRRYARLGDWVAAGNTLLVLSRDPPQEIKDEFVAGAGDFELAEPGLEIPRFESRLDRGDYARALAPDETPVPLAAAWPGGGGKSLALVRPSFLKVDGDKPVRVLAGTPEKAYMVERERGGGRVVLIADTTPLLNYGLKLGDNADIVLSLLDGPGDVYFDEYSLGLGSEVSTMDWLKRAGLIPFILQAVLVFYLLARSADSDFAAPPAREADLDATAEKQIRILGALYEKTLTDSELTVRCARYGSRAAGAKTPRR